MPERAPLRIDWTACEGRGVCHEVAPEVFDLDPWGYPLINEDATTEHAPLARRAARLCPKAALHWDTKS